MRLFEIENKDLSILAEACESWVEMWQVKSAIPIILNHPLSKKCVASPGGRVYRSIFISEEKFKSKNKTQLKNQYGFIPMSYNSSWGGIARSDFDYAGDILQFEKKLNSQDIILNFSQLLAELSKAGHPVYTANESELWMNATPYYRTYTIDELIDIDKS